MSDETDDDSLCIVPSLRVQVTLSWHQRGVGVRKVSYGDRPDAGTLAFLLDCLDQKHVRGEDVFLDEQLLQRLEQLKIIVPEHELPAAILLELPLPSTDPSTSGDPSDGLEWAAGSTLQTSTVLPAEIERRTTKREPLTLSVPILWVDDVRTGVLAPYTLTAEQSTLVESLLAGNTPLADLPLALRSSLVAVGALLRPGEHEAKLQAREACIREAKASLESRGYAVIRNLLAPSQVELYRPYLRALEAEGWLAPDYQVPEQRRSSMHREGLCELLHEQSTGLIDAIVGGARASYSFYGVYRGGAELIRHVDRPQCKWNVSVILDSRPDTPTDEAWPLFIEDRAGTAHPVRLGLGDAVLYSGTDSPHWRETLPLDETVAAVFFHFVPPDFEGDVD